MALDPRTPVLVGYGQTHQRDERPDIEPVDLMAAAAGQADEVVTRFCPLWSKPDLDEIASCFTEDAVYRNIPPTPSVEGREAIKEFIAEFLATLDGIEFIVHRQISDHGVVMHERTDVLRRKDGVEISVPIMGVFEIADGKIATWRDFFDTAITSAFSS